MFRCACITNGWRWENCGYQVLRNRSLEIFKTKRKKNKTACVFKNKLETKVNNNIERKIRKARIKANNIKQTTENEWTRITI
jgi:hypothetical protein